MRWVAVTLVLGCARAPAPPPRPIVPPAVQAHNKCSVPPLSKKFRKAIARQWFVVGEHAVDEERFEDGIHAFEMAYCVLPHPTVAFNLGRAHAHYGEYARSLWWLDVYLASDPADRKEVEEFIERIRQLQARKKQKNGTAMR